MRPTMKLWCAAAVATILALPAQAQDYPNKPVTFITPAAAGNSPDVVTRLVADKLTQLWKQQVVVINRPGAGGTDRGAGRRSNVEKDGYSLYMTQASTYTVLPIQQEGKMPVDLHKAFVPIGMVGEQPIAVAVNKDVPANNVAELIALVNKTQGRHAVRRHQPRRPGASDRRAVPRPLQGQHVVRACGRRGGVAQRRHRRPHPDHVRRASPACHREFRAAAFGFSAWPRRSACPTCRTCRRSTKPCPAWCRAAGSC